SSEDKGGYAKAMDEEFYRRQGELLASVVSQSDVVITTAAIPGKRSPVLITADALRGMPAGGVVVDLAAERGGNCELTQADQRVEYHGLTILGPTNIASDVPHHASLMFSNNATKFLLNLAKKGEIVWNMDDEIIRETLVTRGGEVILPRVRDLLATATSSANPS
ncbi:MAG: NAD(P)(+) transhydrogenase (Re/Si-specific) subunit alpha, partial [Pirellulaceae bacterium]